MIAITCSCGSPLDVPERHDLEAVCIECGRCWNAKEATDWNPEDSSVIDEAEIVRRVTRAVRRADEGFQKAGGTSRHWVRDWFLPEVRRERLDFVEVPVEKEKDEA